MEFKDELLQGIPRDLPQPQSYDPDINHAPKRKNVLNLEERRLALRNALRYFPKQHHEVLAEEFARELQDFGRIYMYRFRPRYPMHARPIQDYPAKSRQAAAIMLMIQNNLDPKVAQHPHELITYGGNGSVFQNWAQYLLTMQYLATMEEDQTLHLYSGHPLGVFPSHSKSPRVVITNGMMVPNYSKPDDWERFNALGVTQYGQMTAGSFMYIGPQGIVHGTTITILNAGRRIGVDNLQGKLYVSSGLGGMSGAQPKAASIAGCISVVAEINPKAAYTRHHQGWVDEIIDDLGSLLNRINLAQAKGETVSLAYLGNVVDLWQFLADQKIKVDIGSDQTSLHNPWSGGYYPAGLDFEEANELLSSDPDRFKALVEDSLCRQVTAINKCVANGMYFFDYGNAFLLEASRAGAPVCHHDGKFIYPSYVQDIMGPMCFDYGFGPFRWVCASGDVRDLRLTDRLAAEVLEQMQYQARPAIKQQFQDNLKWIKSAAENQLVVGSQARILYADANARIAIANTFNEAISRGELGPVILGRDHHDVSGTDSPYRETSNINDGSRFTADMAVHNVIGDSFRGATWVSLHNGGGVGWGEVINGGFGLLLDGSRVAAENLQRMLYFDVNNGLARRSWAGNPGAVDAVENAMSSHSSLRVTLPHQADKDLIASVIK